MASRTLTCNGISAPLTPIAGSIKLRVLVDRGSVEVFGNDGRVAISRGLEDRPGSSRSLMAKTEAGDKGTGFRSIEIGTLGPTWRVDGTLIYPRPSRR